MHALQCGAKLAGALAANGSAERSRMSGRRSFGSNDFVTTSDYSRPTVFERVLKEKERELPLLYEMLLKVDMNIPANEFRCRYKDEILHCYIPNKLL